MARGCSAFLLYSSQFIAAIAILLFGIVSILFARSVEKQHAHDADMERMNPILKIFLTTTAVLTVMMWAAASIAGASMKVSNVRSQAIETIYGRTVCSEIDCL